MSWAGGGTGGRREQWHGGVDSGSSGAAAHLHQARSPRGCRQPGADSPACLADTGDAPTAQNYQTQTPDMYCPRVPMSRGVIWTMSGALCAIFAQVVDVERQRHGGVWFPHDLLGDLLARLGSPAAPPGAARLRPQLQEALHAHHSSALQQSDILEQRSMAVG